MVLSSLFYKEFCGTFTHLSQKCTILHIFATYQVDNTQQLFNGPAPRRCVAISDFIVTFSFSFDNSVVSWRRAAAWPGFYPTYVIARRVGRRLTGKSLQSTMQENKCVFCALIPYIYLCNIHKVTTNVSIIVKLRRGSGKDRQGMAVKAKGLKA